MPEKMNEVERRKDPFRGGVPVRLYDDQIWTFAKPTVNTADGDDGFKTYAEVGDPSYSEAYDNYETAVNNGDDTGIVRWSLRMATLLLQVNYNIARSEVATIVRFAWSAEADPVAFRIREEVMSVALGRGKKTSDDTPDWPQ